MTNLIYALLEKKIPTFFEKLGKNIFHSVVQNIKSSSGEII